jgi:ubiquinone/menaquinone biosynthesis C-methylase UbiE
MPDAEFDGFSEDYYDLHLANITLSGERPEYFSEYKIVDAKTICNRHHAAVSKILDFGSGIGNSIPWLRKYFSEAEVTCADVSERSLETARSRYPGSERFCEIAGRPLPFEDATFDLVFVACVFHHIEHSQHIPWLTELRRVTRPGGLLVIFEHNPWNPLTLHAVNACPFDANARLISSRKLRASIRASGWRPQETWHRIFFPRSLKMFRPLEAFMHAIPIGAQYCVIGAR